MTVAGEVVVNVRGVDVGLAALLTQLEARMRQTDALGIKLAGTTGGTLATGQRAAASSTLSLAQAQARLDVAEGNTASAVQRLTTALAQQSGTTVQTVNAQKQLVTLQSQLSGTSRTLTSSLQGLNSTFGALGLSLGAGALIRGAVDLARVGAEAQQTSIRFEQLAKQAGTTGDAMLNALRQASAGTISDTALQLAAMKASLLGVAQNAEQLGPLLAIARDRAQQMGISVEFAFDSLVTGLGRGSRLILDNVGVIVKAEDANKAYAAQLGRTADSLTEAEQKQALINEVIRQGNETMGKTGGAVDSMVADFARTGAAADNAKAKIGLLVGQLLKVPAQVTTKVAVIVAGGIGTLADADAKLAALQDRVLAVSGSFQVYQQNLKTANDQLAPFGAQLGGLTEQQFAYAQSLIKSGLSAAEAMAKVREFGDAIQAGSLANQDWGASSSILIDRIIAVSQGSAEGKAAVDGLVAAYQLGGLSSERFAGAISVLEVQQERARQAAAEESRESRLLASSHDAAAEAATRAANAEQVAAIDAQTAGVAHAQLAQAAQNGANALLAAGAAGASQAQRLAGSSKLIDVLTAAFYRLAAAKAAASVDIASGRPETGGDAIARFTGAAARNQGFLAVQTERATAAQNAQTLATGSTAAKVKLLTAEYERQRRIFGANSAEAINAQTKLIQAQDKAGKAAKAGGGVRLSDQQKLNNSLLATDERYQNQAEDAEAAHQQRLIEIDNQARERMKAAQAAFDQDRLDSRAGFYEGLAGIEDQGLRKAMSAKFEAAVLESNEIAKTKGADAAQHFLDEARKAIEAEARLQGEIDKAKKDGKTGEAEYLEGVKKLQEAADKARLDNIRNQGSDIVTERDKQLADEQAKYEQQTGKILTASERATAAKIANAQREGKAVSDVNALYQDQEATLNRIGARAGGVPAVPSTTGGVPTTPAAAAGAPGAVDLGGAFEGLRAAVAAVESAVRAVGGDITGAQRDTTGAVRGLSGKLVN
jgi:hypothetical protein